RAPGQRRLAGAVPAGRLPAARGPRPVRTPGQGTVKRSRSAPGQRNEVPMLAAAKNLLGHVPLYVALQRALGADRLRYRCLDELALSDGDTVIDVGCGPAYYFNRLPKVRY